MGDSPDVHLYPVGDWARVLANAACKNNARPSTSRLEAITNNNAQMAMVSAPTLLFIFEGRASAPVAAVLGLGPCDWSRRQEQHTLCMGVVCEHIRGNHVAYNYYPVRIGVACVRDSIGARKVIQTICGSPTNVRDPSAEHLVTHFMRTFHS